MQKKNKSASVTVVLMIAAMLISKLLGMLRGVLLAASYDISEKATAFSAASRIPLSFFDIVFASAILGCFIPVYNSFNKEDSSEKKKEFTSIYLNFLLLLTGLFTLLGIIFARPLIELVSPGLSVETKNLAVLLLRIMFPLIVFAAASYTFVGVLQSNGNYIVPAFISAISNLFIILYFIFFDSSFGIKGLACAYTLAWLVQLLTLVIPVIKTGYRYKALFNFKNEGFLCALKMTPSIMMGSWFAPLSLLISMRFASLTGVQGAVPSFEYAVNLFTVVTGITTYGVCNYIFPKLSSIANSENEEFSKITRTGLTSAILMTVPIAFLVFSLTPQGVSIVYMRGSFDVLAAQQVTTVLRALVPGMLGFTLVEFLSRVFYAIKKPIFPVVSVLIGIIADLICVYTMVEFFDGGLFLIGFSYSIGMLSAGIVMLIFAIFKINGFFSAEFAFNLFKIIIAGIVCSFIMFYFNNKFFVNVYEMPFAYNVSTAVISAVAGTILYFVFLLILREKNVCSVIKIKKKG